MLKVSIVILTVGLVYGVVYSVLNTFAPDLTVATTYEAVSGESFETLKDVGYRKTLTGETRQIGIMGFTAMILTGFILYTAYRKAERWAWWALFSSSLLFYVYSLLRHLIIGDMLNAMMILAGMVVALVGMLLPLKIFFGKKEQ